MSKPMLEIIVTHYNEPWDVGRKFFHMLSLQRSVDFNSYRVTLVQDGREGELDWGEIFSTCPFKVNVITLEQHSGVARARNAGLNESTSDWVMFCDFDDMFADVYSLSMTLGVLPTDKADVLWMPTYREQYIRAKQPFVNCIDEDFTNVVGKLFRKSFLTDRGITFPDIPFESESAFCAIVLAEIRQTRIMKITTKFTMYTKTLRPDSYTRNRETVSKMIESIFYSDVFVVEEFKRRNKPDDMRTSVAKTVYDTYVLLNSRPSIKHKREILDLFVEFYEEHKDTFRSIRPEELEIVEHNAYGHVVQASLDLYNNFTIEPATPEIDQRLVLKWLNTLPSSESIRESRKLKSANMDERVVVYTGTKNTYECIYASMKSVYDYSRVDKVYLLIEDDEFPYEVPDSVQVINVKDQNYFNHDGPNFKNAWSYMCMMRGAFPDMFPQHSKILSLDIDIILTGNIDSLWNMDISDYYFAGVPEPSRDQTDYANFGVIMMNLDLMRKDNVGAEVIALLNTEKLGCPEQDAFNSVCAGRILSLPSIYNYTPYTHITAEPQGKTPLITHYAGISYWRNFKPVQKYLKKSWNEILGKNHTTKRNSSQEKAAVYCGTRNVYSQMVAAAKSLIYNTPSIDQIYFLIEDDQFPEPLPDYIKCINVSDQTFFAPDGPNFSTQWTYMVLMRAALPKLLPDVDRILSIDNDTIVNEDISALWDIDLSDSYIAAVRETLQLHKPEEHYFNCGVMMMNLKKLRDDGMCDRIIREVDTVDYEYNEQDVINKLCAGSIYELPPEYNDCIATEAKNGSYIKHYCGPMSVKVKLKFDNKPYRDLSWDDLAKIREGSENG